MNKTPLLSAFFVVLTLLTGTLSAGAAPTLHARDYRPLMAKAVKIETAGKATPASQTEGALFTKAGWKHFDAKQWDAAIDKFLSALEKDARDHSAAEGIAMTLYRSEDFASAARLVDELLPIMPGVKEILARTVTAEVRELVAHEEKEAAGKLLAHFPASDAAYREAHELLDASSAIETALRDKTKSGDSLAGN